MRRRVSLFSPLEWPGIERRCIVLVVPPDLENSSYSQAEVSLTIEKKVLGEGYTNRTTFGNTLTYVHEGQLTFNGLFYLGRCLLRRERR